MDVPPPEIPLNSRVIDELRNEIDPSIECGDYGIELYTNCVSFMESRIWIISIFNKHYYEHLVRVYNMHKEKTITL